MKIFLISNTRFGYRRGDRGWHGTFVRYFEDELIPLLKERSRPGDTLVHLGGLFDSPTTVSTDIATDVVDLFKRITAILPTHIIPSYRDLTLKGSCLPGIVLRDLVSVRLSGFNVGPKEGGRILLSPTIGLNPLMEGVVYVGADTHSRSDSAVHVGPPYPIDREGVYGVVVLDCNKGRDLLVPNQGSPRFSSIIISSEEDMISVDPEFVSKNRVTATVDVTTFKEKMGVVDLFLSRHKFYKVVILEPEPEVRSSPRRMNPTDAVRMCLGGDAGTRAAFERVVGASSKE